MQLFKTLNFRDSEVVKYLAAIKVAARELARPRESFLTSNVT